MRWKEVAVCWSPRGAAEVSGIVGGCVGAHQDRFSILVFIPVFFTESRDGVLVGCNMCGIFVPFMRFCHGGASVSRKFFCRTGDRSQSSRSRDETFPSKYQLDIRVSSVACWEAGGVMGDCSLLGWCRGWGSAV